MNGKSSWWSIWSLNRLSARSSILISTSVKAKIREPGVGDATFQSPHQVLIVARFTRATAHFWIAAAVALTKVPQRTEYTMGVKLVQGPNPV